MSIVKTDQIQDRNGNPLIAVADGVATGSFAPVGMRNRIINGDMRIDQRNNGAAVTPTASVHTLDRWLAALTQSSKYSVQQSSVAPSGFNNSLLVTSLSAYSVASGDFFLLRHYVEGFNFADLGWGSANAQSVTMSFWVRSSLTGTFGGSLQNSAENRSYPFTYTISAANTWEQKTLTIAGDTSGTWVGSTNGVGVRINFGLGAGSTFGGGTAGAWAGSDFRSATGAVSVVGTDGATFYITGVQLEAGSVATPFERRQFGQELALCQRYFYKYPNEVAWGMQTVVLGATFARTKFEFKVSMRSAPTIAGVTYNSTTNTGSVEAQFISTDSVTLTANPTLGGSGQFGGNWTASSEL
jgi:hypothetical protein